MNKQDQNLDTTPSTREQTAAPEPFTVQAHDAEDLSVVAFERAELTDVNFGF